MYVFVPHACLVQPKGRDVINHLELKLQIVVSHKWVLEINSVSTRRMPRAMNYSAISLA